MPRLPMPGLHPKHRALSAMRGRLAYASKKNTAEWQVRHRPPLKEA